MSSEILNILNRSELSWTAIFHQERGKTTLINNYLCRMRGVHDLGWWFKNNQNCYTVLLHRIVNSLRNFRDFLKLNSLFSKPIKLNGLLKIYLLSLVVLYQHYEADTKADKVVLHIYGLFFVPFIFMVFYCNG